MLINRTADYATAPDEPLYVLRAAALVEEWLRSSPGTPMPARIDTRCPECESPDDGNGLHATYRGFILVGCEGYWVINPNLLGFDKPLWTNDAGEPE